MGEDYSNHGQEAIENENQPTIPPKGELTDKLWYDEKHSFPIPEKVMKSIQFNAGIIGPQIPLHIKTDTFLPGYYELQRRPAFVAMLEEKVRWALQDIVGALRDALINFDGPERAQFRTLQSALEREILRLDSIETWARETVHYDPVVILNVLEALEQYPELDPRSDDEDEEQPEQPGDEEQPQHAGHSPNIGLDLKMWAGDHKGLLKALGLIIWDIHETTLDKRPDFSALDPLREALEKHLGEIQGIAMDCYRSMARKPAHVGPDDAIRERDQGPSPVQ